MKAAFAKTIGCCLGDKHGHTRDADRLYEDAALLATPSMWRSAEVLAAVQVSGAIATTDLMRSLGEQSRADYARSDDRESENSECCQWIHAGPASS
jgi:hypothetical protein